MNILDAAYEVLKLEKKPMKCADLTAEMTERGLWQPGGPTPKDSVGASIYEDIKKLGEKSRFAKAGHGYFMLSSIVKVRKKSNEGFVYILTHPCFLPNIVKIGKTQGAVEDRAKQLFTTSLPKEFNIYATLRTSKFSETEELMHDYFNAKRISLKREFFNISPAEALDVFRKVQRLLSDGEITEDWKRQKPFEDDDKSEKGIGKAMSVRQKVILTFWTAFNKYAEKNEAFMAEFNLRKPGKYCYYDFGIDHSTHHVFMRVTSKKGIILCGIYVSKAKQVFESFQDRREEIEKFVGSKVEWNMAKMDGAFSVVKEFDINAPQSEWPMAFKWLCETAIRFKRVDERFGLAVK